MLIDRTAHKILKRQQNFEFFQSSSVSAGTWESVQRASLVFFVSAAGLSQIKCQGLMYWQHVRRFIQYFLTGNPDRLVRN